MLFRTLDDALIPVGRIAEIRFWRRDGAKRIFAVDLINPEQTVPIDEETVEKIKMRSIAVVSAANGTKLIDAHDPSETPIEAEVIAWSIDGEGFPTPITADGLNDGCTNPWAVVHPSGRVVMPLATSFDNVDQYIEYLRDYQKATTSAIEPKAA